MSDKIFKSHTRKITSLKVEPKPEIEMNFKTELKENSKFRGGIIVPEKIEELDFKNELISEDLDKKTLVEYNEKLELQVQELKERWHVLSSNGLATGLDN